MSERIGDEPVAEEEVRPDELTAGIGVPVGESAFPPDVVEALRAPLDPNRVRRRQGRGRGQFEYLAGHDVKRRANELFGFGNWGHEVRELVEIGAVDVQSSGDDPKPGIHVGYRCTVRVWIAGAGTRYYTEGVGYGDGVEYGAAARITACELAMKEAETDALKRAFTDLGDQFGLILYAKGDEKARIAKDANASAAVAKQAQRSNVPQGWGELTERWRWLFGGPGNPFAEATARAWMSEALQVKYGVAEPGDLTVADRKLAGQLLASVLLLLEEGDPDRLLFGPDVRKTVADAFAQRLDGTLLEGPAWRIDKTETDRPDFESPTAQEPSSAPESAGGDPRPPEPDEAGSGAQAQPEKAT